MLIQFITRRLKATYCTKHLPKIIHAFWPLTPRTLTESGAQQRVMWRLVLVGHQCSLAEAQAAFPHAQRSYRSDYYLHWFSALIRIPICCLSSPHNTSSTHSQYCPVMLYFYTLTSASLPHSTVWRQVEGLASIWTQIINLLLSIRLIISQYQIIQSLICGVLLSSW